MWKYIYEADAPDLLGEGVRDKQYAAKFKLRTGKRWLQLDKFLKCQNPLPLEFSPTLPRGLEAVHQISKSSTINWKK